MSDTDAVPEVDSGAAKRKKPNEKSHYIASTSNQLFLCNGS
jgi:hypothetical protein